MALRMGIKGIFALAATFVASNAYALGVSIVGDYAMANVSSPSITGQTTNYGWGGGGLLNFGSGHVGFELGGLYSPRGYNLSGNAVNGYQLRIPLLITVSESILHVGAGGFYAFTVGTPTVNGSPVSSGQLNSTDYGVEGAAGLHIPFGHVLKLVVEGRYVYGLGNQSAVAGTTINWRNIEALVGFHFGM